MSGQAFHPAFGGRSINLGNGMYEELKTVPSNICNGLFSAGEDGFGTRGMASICKLLRRYQAFKRKLSKLRHRSCSPNDEYTGR